MKNFLHSSVILFLLLLLRFCSHHFSYIPPPDAQIETGHFALFFNELYPKDSKVKETFEPTVVSVNIIQEGQTIISDRFNAGSWNLYPVPEGVFVVDLEIDYPRQPVTLQRTFNSKIGSVNTLYVEFWRVEPVELQSNVQAIRANYAGETLHYILNSKRAGKQLSFDDVQRFETKR